MIIGHELVFQHLATAIEIGQHHGFLLSGPKGIGKATTAKNIAISALEKASLQPVLIIKQQCASGAYPNYSYLTRLKDDNGRLKPEITVDQIRTLLDSLKLKAAYPGPRFVIIDAIDDLNHYAANALLKILEEPPSNTILLLVCHSLGRILPTIRSRCLNLHFKKLSDANLEKIVNIAGFAVDPLISAIAHGSAGYYLEIQRAGGVKLITAIERLLKITDLSELKNVAQTVLKNDSDTLILKTLHQILYQKSLAQPNVYAESAQAVERFMRFTDNTYLDQAHRICAAVLLIQKPNQQELIYS